MPFITDAITHCRRWVSPETIARWSRWATLNPHWVAAAPQVAAKVVTACGVAVGLTVAALHGAHGTPTIPSPRAEFAWQDEIAAANAALERSLQATKPLPSITLPSEFDKALAGFLAASGGGPGNGNGPQGGHFGDAPEPLPVNPAIPAVVRPIPVPEPLSLAILAAALVALLIVSAVRDLIKHAKDWP